MHNKSWVIWFGSASELPGSQVSNCTWLPLKSSRDLGAQNINRNHRLVWVRLGPYASISWQLHSRGTLADTNSHCTTFVRLVKQCHKIQHWGYFRSMINGKYPAKLGDEQISMWAYPICQPLTTAPVEILELTLKSSNQAKHYRSQIMPWLTKVISLLTRFTQNSSVTYNGQTSPCKKAQQVNKELEEILPRSSLRLPSWASQKTAPVVTIHINGVLWY